MAKTMKDLTASREVRKAVIQKYGFIPGSVLELDYGWGRHVIELEGRKQDNVAAEKHKKMEYGDSSVFGDGKKNAPNKKELKSAFGMSSKNIRGKGLSTFPPALARFIVDFYSEPGDVVLDEFAGHNSRLQVTHELGRHYIGYEICEEFIAFNKKVADEITGKGSQKMMFTPGVTITLREQTSEKIVEADSSIDMSFSSPPYWNLEDYGTHPDQLGIGKTYDEFLAGLQRVVNECYRVLKKDKYCIFNVNDFRKEGKFYCYHADTINIFKIAGFKIHDIVIVKWASAMGSCFASQIIDRKITYKAHEYLIVGRKP